MKNTFELEHVGINTDNAGEAEQLALLLCIALDRKFEDLFYFE